MNAQAGLRLCCSQTTEDRFSCIKAHIILLFERITKALIRRGFAGWYMLLLSTCKKSRVSLLKALVIAYNIESICKANNALSNLMLGKKASFSRGFFIENKHRAS